MIKVLVSGDKTFAVNINYAGKVIRESLARLKCPDNAEISVSFVDRAKMSKITRRYLKDKKTHEIISFPLTVDDPSCRFPVPDNVVRLGEIVISYPEAVKLARLHRRPISQEINFLLDHGCRHLMGHHHR